MFENELVNLYVSELMDIEHVTVHDDLESWCKQDLEAVRHEDDTFREVVSASVVSMIGTYPAMTVSDIHSALIGMNFMLYELTGHDIEIIGADLNPYQSDD